MVSSAVDPKRITLLPGDGIGPEVVAVGKEVIQAVADRFSLELELDEGFIGVAALERYGDPYPPEIREKVAGSRAVLLGAAFSAIGLFASALTRNQIIAFISAMAICFTLTLIDKMLFFLPRSMLGILAYMGADFHFQNISKGIIDSRDIIYFLSVCFLGLYAANLALQEKQ